MKKTLELVPVRFKAMHIVCQIVKQSHLDEEFGNCGCQFTATNGVVLKSRKNNGPGYCTSYGCSSLNIALHVRTSFNSPETSEQNFDIPMGTLALVKEAVNQYNAFDFPNIIPSCEGKVVEVDGKKYKLTSV